MHFRTEKKKKKKFGFLALLVCHTKAAFGGTADCAPSAQSWFHPFLSLLYCRYPESSTGEEQGVPRGCKGMSEQFEAALGGWDGELELRR